MPVKPPPFQNQEFHFFTLHLFLDVNGDGLNELIVTLTDRVVRTYQWRSFSKSIDSIGYQGENFKYRAAHNVCKLRKMSHLDFLILAFSPDFVLVKSDLSGNTV